jgi:hypothetical protein
VLITAAIIQNKKENLCVFETDRKAALPNVLSSTNMKVKIRPMKNDTEKETIHRTHNNDVSI